MKNKLLILVCCSVLFVIYLIIGCPFRFLLGIPCPGCGMSRAYYAFFDGDFSKAFFNHPLFLLIPPFAVILGGGNSKILKSKKAKSALLKTGIAVILIVYIIRMVILFPGTAPMVYNSDAIVNKIFL